jgi:hypothetical protein
LTAQLPLSRANIKTNLSIITTSTDNMATMDVNMDIVSTDNTSTVDVDMELYVRPL